MIGNGQQTTVLSQVLDFQKLRWELLLSIIGWYSSNVGLLVSNSYILRRYVGFRRPVFLTFCHMLSCTVFSLIFVATNVVKLQYIKSRKQFAKIILLSALFSFSVALGNASLKYIPVSFNQSIGATTPLFTALLAFLIQGKQENADTYKSLLPIVIGTAMASWGEPSFNIYGFIAAFLATFSRAFKSVVQALLLSEPDEKLNGMNLLLYMAPISCLLLVPCILLLEPMATAEFAKYYEADHYFLVMIVFNSIIAYFVNLCNFLVTKYTSALSLQVLGIVKGIVAVVISILVFRNPISLQGMLGYSLSLVGIYFYQQSKINDQNRRAADNLKTKQITKDLYLKNQLPK